MTDDNQAMNDWLRGGLQPGEKPKRKPPSSGNQEMNEKLRGARARPPNPKPEPEQPAQHRPPASKLDTPEVRAWVAERRREEAEAEEAKRSGAAGFGGGARGTPSEPPSVDALLRGMHNEKRMRIAQHAIDHDRDRRNTRALDDQGGTDA